MKSFLLFTAATSLVASQALAAIGTAAEQPPTKLPTKLPKAMKKKTKLNFEENSGTHVTTVIVRTPLPLEKALEDQQQAANQVVVISSAKPAKSVDVANPIPAPTPLEDKTARFHVLPEATTEASHPRRFLIDEPLLVKPESPLSTEKDKLAGEAVLPTDAGAKSKEDIAAPITTSPAPSASTEFMGPPAPPVVEVSVTTLTTNPPAPSVAVEAPSAPVTSAQTADVSLATTVTRPVALHENRIYLRSSVLNARYAEIDSNLDNGARGLGIGWARQYGDFEGRGSIELGYGKGQEISLENTRYLIARADALYFFRSGHVRPFAGFGVGVGQFDVRLPRPTANPDEVLFREYAKGSAAILSPSTGIRFDWTNFAVDLSAEYLAVLGAGSTSALGGWTGALTLSFPF